MHIQVVKELLFPVFWFLVSFDNQELIITQMSPEYILKKFVT